VTRHHDVGRNRIPAKTPNIRVARARPGGEQAVRSRASAGRPARLSQIASHASSAAECTIPFTQMSRRFLFVILDPLFDVCVRRRRKLPRSRVLPKKNSENLNIFFVWFSGLGTSGRKEAWRKARQRYAQEEEIIDVSGCRWGSLELEFYRYSLEFH